MLITGKRCGQATGERKRAGPFKDSEPSDRKPESAAWLGGWVTTAGSPHPWEPQCSDLRRADCIRSQRQRRGRRWACATSCGTKCAKGRPSGLRSWGPGWSGAEAEGSVRGQTHLALRSPGRLPFKDVKDGKLHQGQFFITPKIRVTLSPKPACVRILDFRVLIAAEVCCP